MNEKTKSLAESLRQRFGDRISIRPSAGGILTVGTEPGAWLETCRALRDEEPFEFDQLTDLCGVDYLGYGQSEWETTDATDTGFGRGVDELGPGRFDWANRPEAAGATQRFAIVAHLLSYGRNQRLRVSCFAPDEGMLIVPSLVEIWSSANWYEREAFDLFGVVFEGHPDLRRILTDYGFTGHPFRKDFPLIGNVSVRYDSEKKRIVYEPVEIEPRVGVPRVIREDSRYKTDELDRAADSMAEMLAAEDAAPQEQKNG